MRLYFLLLGSAASASWAQSPSPQPRNPPPPAAEQAAGESDPAEAEEEEIIIRAQSDQRTAIDRETYEVRDTAVARSSNALDLLGRIPQVTVQPDNSIRLLGTSGVTVLIDGRPSPNPNILRDLQGSEIVRIEVVSNPSAQFSASGTGGIINIITRRNALDGFRGSVTASVSRYGGHELRAAPSWTRGDWSLSGNLGWVRNGSISRVERERISLDPILPLPDLFETLRSRSRFEFANAGGQVSYRPTEKSTVTFQGGLIDANGRVTTDSRLDLGGTAFDRLTVNDFGYQGYNASIEYREEGQRAGEQLTTSLLQYRFSSENELVSDLDPGRFSFNSRSLNLARIFKLDYVRPFANGHRLLIGGSLNHGREFLRLEQDGDFALGPNPFPTASIIDGTSREAASYASYQLPLLGGTALAGLRIEGRDYDFADPALGNGPADHFLFPSLHLERRFDDWLTAQLSYSRRISWPAVQQLSPALRFIDPTTAYAGNPDLRPELTDSLEARARAQIEGQTVSLTLFGRFTDDLFSNLNELIPAGILVSRPVNIGQRRDLGASMAVQGTIVRGLSYTLNANLIDRSIDGEEAGRFWARRSANYSATGQVDYRDGVDGRRGADRLTVTANYSGPYDDGLVRRSSFFRIGASWSHALTDRLSTILTVDDLLGPTRFRTSTISDSAATRSISFSDGPRIKLALTYSFGRPGQQQPPSQGPAAPNVPFPGTP